ncbi:MAG: hypothetical protein BWY46_01281 [Firmicutes bacterium ADurb.Bin300]|nr:MAG: hypothetical protein BWY46_01281 [Firmicutes bacterium ADurb.Bin300]
MIDELLRQRHLPDLLRFIDGEKVTRENWDKRREEIIRLLSQEYGDLPPAPVSVNFLQKSEESFCAGKANLVETILICNLKEGGEFSFPVKSVIPVKDEKQPSFILINFHDDVPDRYLPSEELCDLGFAVHSFCYKDITSDDENYNGKLASFYCGKKENLERGKIALWAWAAIRVLDFVLTLPETDPEEIALIGHSRLGKTALLAGGLDTRFTTVISNNSGCSGAALSRDKEGETIKKIFNRFPYWFKSGYGEYADKEHELPFDQHFLLALCAPRKLYIASAALDSWADPLSEFLSASAATAVYELLGEKGLDSDNLPPEENVLLHEGKIGYHKRSGTHYLSRFDWNAFARFIKTGC